MSTYVKELVSEQDSLSKDSHAYRLIQAELARVQKSGDLNGHLAITEDVVILEEKVFIPVKQFPKFNFIGKLFGPQGNTFKRLQQQTRSRMVLQGRGSVKDKEKEEEMRNSEDEKHAHLNEDLHVLISVKAPKAEAHSRLANALKEIKPYLRPEKEDQISKDQMREMAAIKGGYELGDAEQQEERSPMDRSPVRGGHQIIYPGGDLPPNLPPGAIIIQMPGEGDGQFPNSRYHPYANKK